MLPDPARYFPPAGGRYETTPGLRPLGTDYGNGALDAHVFQRDARLPVFRASKAACMAEDPAKYIAVDDFEPIRVPVTRFLAERLRADGWPADADTLGPFEEIGLRIAEDIAVVRMSPERGDWIAALHLCSPSHWRASDKIGRSFLESHAPVPGMEKTIAAAPALLETMVRRGPFVRFTWGLAADDRLNCHPDGHAVPAFDASRNPPFFVRPERQVLWPLPEIDAFVFVVRVSHIAATDLTPAERSALRSALLSMPEASRVYKSIAAPLPGILAWLDACGTIPP